MYLENLVVDAVDPQRLGGFWEAALGGERLTDEPGILETRLSIEGGPVLDVCFQQVPETPSLPPRLHLDLAGEDRQAAVVERLLGLGARHLDLPQRDAPWTVLADPEGNPFCVKGRQAAYDVGGPIAALPLDSADPERDTAFWAWLTGWTAVGLDGRSLQHPSRRGPLLGLCPEPAAQPEGAKNRLHLDVRLESGDDPRAVEAGILERGGRRVERDWGDLGWRLFADPSGNDFCVLPVRR